MRTEETDTNKPIRLENCRERQTRLRAWETKVDRHPKLKYAREGRMHREPGRLMRTNSSDWRIIKKGRGLSRTQETDANRLIKLENDQERQITSRDQDTEVERHIRHWRIINKDATPHHTARDQETESERRSRLENHRDRHHTARDQETENDRDRHRPTRLSMKSKSLQLGWNYDRTYL